MASWVLAHPPWHSLSRVPIRWDMLVKLRGWTRTGRHFLTTPTLSLHVDLDEETPAMRQIKAHPYPSSPPDPSLFEESTDEYATASLTESEVALFNIPSGAPPCTLLKFLVKAQRFEDAERVYTELADLGIEIQHHPVYHLIARRILSAPGIASQKRLETFIKWWSLVPARSEVNCSRSVGFILTELLRKDHIPDVPLIASFALLAASKGYANQVGLELVQRVARYAPPDFTKHLLEELCVTTWNYKAKNQPPSPLSKRVNQNRFRTWYDAAILTLVDTGKCEFALKLLKLADSRELWVKNSTRKIVMSASQAQANWIVSHARQRKGKARSLISSDVLDGKSELKSLLNSSAAVHVPQSGKTVQLAMCARSLQRAFREGSPVPAAQIAKIIAVFLRFDRKSALRRLRDLAYRSGASTISTWALAEMTFYAKRNYFQSSLHVFEQHFDHVGVPSEIFIPVQFSEQRLANIKAPVVALQQIGPVPSLYRRLPPSKEHIYLLWKLSVENANRPVAASKLYRAFVNLITKTQCIPPNAYPLPRLPTPVMPPADQPVEYLQPIPPQNLFDSRCFDVFVIKFFSYGYISYASRVVVDMFCLGFPPHNDTQRAFLDGLHFKSGLEAVERRLEYWQKSVDRAIERTGNLTLRPAHDTSPKQRLRMLSFFFRAAIKRLVRDGRLEDALYVAKRLMETAPNRSDLVGSLKRDMRLHRNVQT